MLWVGSLIDFGLCALLELLSTLFASILLQNTFDCALCGAFGYSLYPVEVQPEHHAPAMRTPRGPRLPPCAPSRSLPIGRHRPRHVCCAVCSAATTRARPNSATSNILVITNMS